MRLARLWGENRECPRGVSAHRGQGRQISSKQRGQCPKDAASCGNPKWGWGLGRLPGGKRRLIREPLALAYVGSDVTQEEGKVIGQSLQVSLPSEGGFLSRSGHPPCQSKLFPGRVSLDPREKKVGRIWHEMSPGSVRGQMTITQSCGEGCGFIW